MSFNRISDMCLILGFALWCGTHLFFQGDGYVLDHYAPEASALALYVVAAALVMALRDPALRLFGVVWVIWPVLSTYFTIGQLAKRALPFQVDYANGNTIYYISIIAMLATIHIVMIIRPLPKEQKDRRRLSMMEAAPLLIFVPVYLIDLVMSGSTLFSGGNIVGEMYTIDRSAIYSYRTILVLAVGYLFLLFQRTKGTNRNFVATLLVTSIAICVLDGKRVLALIAILNCVYAVTILSKESRGAGKLAMAILLTVLAYGFVGNLRADRETNLGGWTDVATIAGVEYRDFVYSVNQWTPEYMKELGYDYVGSAAATLINQKIIEAVGADKNALVMSDSARTWQRAFQVQDGIRIGLVGELYFAFPNQYILAISIFGAFAALVRIAIAYCKTELGFIALSTQLSLVTLAVFSQSTVTFGTIPTLIYILIAMWLWRKILIFSGRLSPAQEQFS